MAEIIDMLGRKIDRLFVFNRAQNYSRGQARWHCLCECGKETVVLGKDLRSGNTKSCGCLQSEIIKAQQRRSLIHGHNRRNKTTEIYHHWKNLRHLKKTCLGFPAFLRETDVMNVSMITREAQGKNRRQRIY